MPNRTIYLPDDLDELSRQLGLNLSQLTQKAIRQSAHEQGEEALDARVELVTQRVKELGIDWPEDYLGHSRRESGER